MRIENMIQPRLLKGFRDALPNEAYVREQIIVRLKQSLSSFGFVPIDTPVLEYTEVLLGKGGGETDKQVYRFQDHGNRDVSMRFDLTVPLARFVAQHEHELSFPFRRYHMEKVWRGENTQKGRYREFIQSDFDIVGDDSSQSDFEILLLMKTALEEIGVDNFSIQFNHRGILNELLKQLELGQYEVEILRLIDKLGKIGREKVKDELTELIGARTEAIIQFIDVEGTNLEILSELEKLVPQAEEPISRVRSILSLLQAMDIEDTFSINTSITRGLDYYTGIVFETFLPDLPEYGSVCSGGRYNNLAGLYTKTPIPGVGAAIGLDRLIAALNEKGLLKDLKPGAELAVFALDPEYAAEYQKIADTLRKSGVKTEVLPMGKKMQWYFKQAEKKSISHAIICGANEFSSQTYQLKNLINRETSEYKDLQELSQVVLQELR
jgi:histidyl-tRNA synthetase